jgi:hypothetical protein
LKRGHLELHRPVLTPQQFSRETQAEESAADQAFSARSAHELAKARLKELQDAIKSADMVLRKDGGRVVRDTDNAHDHALHLTRHTAHTSATQLAVESKEHAEDEHLKRESDMQLPHSSGAYVLYVCMYVCIYLSIYLSIYL